MFKYMPNHNFILMGHTINQHNQSGLAMCTTLIVPLHYRFIAHIAATAAHIAHDSYWSYCLC